MRPSPASASTAARQARAASCNVAFASASSGGSITPTRYPSSACEPAVRRCSESRARQQIDRRLAVRLEHLQRGRVRARGRAGFETHGHRRDRRMLEHIPHGERAAELCVDRMRETHRAQRIAAEIEEAALDLDGAVTEQRRPDREQTLLRRRRRYSLHRRQRPCGERAAIYLAVHRERKAVTDDDLRGHHVIRQLPAQRAAQRLGTVVRIRIEARERDETARLAFAEREHRGLDARAAVGSAPFRSRRVRRGSRGS